MCANNRIATFCFPQGGVDDQAAADFEAGQNAVRGVYDSQLGGNHCEVMKQREWMQQPAQASPNVPRISRYMRV